MESYIVRIYRRNIDDPREIIGFVEIVGSDMKKSFNTFDELRMIINNEMKTKSMRSDVKIKERDRNS
jgi:hypothetical protein